MIPNDPLYALQWHFNLIGDIETIWDEFDGTGVNVGIYDDGVDYYHEDLSGNYDPSLDIVDVLGAVVDPFPALSGDAHGTAVAGIIAGEANNGLGGTGVAGGATITGVNIFDPGSYGYINAADFEGFLEFIDAVEQASQFDIMNNSWGNYAGFFDSLADPSSADTYLQNSYALIALNGRNGLGTIVVQSAGNDNVDANGDGTNASRLTITVAATDASGNAADYTNFGQSILVAAPAAGMTTDITDTGGYNDGAESASYNGNYTSTFGGTSAATPVVSGVIALMLDANEGLGWRDVQNILAMSATHTGSSITGPGTGFEDGSWFINAADNWNGGGMHFHVNYGYGMVDAFGAVRMAEVWHLFDDAQTSANEVNSQSESTAVNQNIPDADNGSVSFTINVNFNMSIEHVALIMDFQHTYIGDLEILLESAEGTQIVLTSSNFSMDTNFNGEWYFGIDSLLGEMSQGVWTVTITDNFIFDVGFVEAAYLDFFGTTPSVDDVYHYTSEIGDAILLDASRENLSDTNGGIDWINTAAIAEGVFVDMASIGSGFGYDRATDSVFVRIENGTVIENLVSGDGDDIIYGNEANNEIHGMRGNDYIYGDDGNDTLYGGAGNDYIDGGDDNDTLYGGAGNDTLIGGLGNDLIYGGDGTDTSILYGLATESGVLRFGNIIQVFSDGVDNRTWHENVEILQFHDISIDVETLVSNDLNSYLASYSDLVQAFGNNQAAALNHFYNYGYYEGRSLDAFDEYSYLASYSDLLNAFGSNGEMGASHYVTYGYSEGRILDIFDEITYVASYGDLINAFGTNSSAATQHYVDYGFWEGRNSSFNVEQYLSNYSDLQAAFVDDMMAATLHFIDYGYYEGRTDDYLV